MITIELPKQTRSQAIVSIQKYFEENMPEAVGELAAGLLLDFFVEEVGPVSYNRAIADAQDRLQLRVSDLSGELYGDEFQYWQRLAAKKNRQR